MKGILLSVLIVTKPIQRASARMSRKARQTGERALQAGHKGCRVKISPFGLLRLLHEFLPSGYYFTLRMIYEERGLS